MKMKLATVTLVAAASEMSAIMGVSAKRIQQLPWWHPEIQYIADELIAAPPGHPLLDDDSDFQDFVKTNTNKKHQFFDGEDGYLLAPFEIPKNHPNCDQYFELEETPYDDFPVVYFDHPDIHEAFRQGKPLPEGHPSVFAMLAELLPAGHPNIDDLFLEPKPLPEWHPDLSIMLQIEELPRGNPSPVQVYFDHPDITESYEKGRPTPQGHPSVADILIEYLPPGHPLDLDEMMQNPAEFPLPFGHPSLSSFISVEQLPKGEPSVTIYFEHHNITETYEKGNPIPEGHPSVTDMLVEYLPPGHPFNLDEMMLDPTEFPLPFGHPSLASFLSITDLPRGTPTVPVYFDHPNITESYERGRGIPEGHPSIADVLVEYLPPGHPTNLDQMIQNPTAFPLPFGHPSLASFISITDLPRGTPSVPIYFDHPNITESYMKGQGIPEGHPSIVDLLADYLPPGHPANLDQMMQNPTAFPLPLGHPSLSSFISTTELPRGTPSVSVYFDHPNITESYTKGRSLPEGHPFIADMLVDYLPPGHPANLDEMMQDPTAFPLPLGHPSLSSFVSIDQLPMGEPSVSVYFDHPNIAESYERGYPIPKGHPSVSDLLVEYLPPGHPLNLDEMMLDPAQYPLPFGHPSLATFVSAQALPRGSPSVSVYFDHPNINDSYERGRGIPEGHHSITDILVDYLPPGHPLNLDEMMQDPNDFPLPFGHPSLSSFVSIQDLPQGSPSVPVFPGHPDIDESLRSGDSMPSSHPSVSALLEEYLPPGHPINLDEMLVDPIKYPLPLGHPSLSSFLSRQDTGSEISRSFLMAADLSLSVFTGHPDIIALVTENPIDHHPPLHHLFADILPSTHPNIDDLMEEGFTFPTWHPSIKSMVAPRSLAVSPGALLCYAFSALFVAALVLRNTKSWYNSKQTKEIIMDNHRHSETTAGTFDDSCAVDGIISINDQVEVDLVFPSPSYDSSAEIALPRLDQRHHNAMELHRLHHDSDTEAVRSNIIAYQEKSNTRLRSAWISIVGKRVIGTHTSNGDIIFYLFYLLVNVVALLVSPYDFNVGFGSLAAGNIVFLVVSATKNSVFTWFLGIPFDQIIVYHHFLGRATVALALIHACFYFNHPIEFMSDHLYKTGLIALIFGIVITVSSINLVRRYYFNAFYWSHLAFVGFIVCVYMHAHGARPFVLVSIAFYAIDKILHLAWTQLPRKTMLIQTVGERGTAFVRFGKTPLARLLGRYKVGQYVFVNFPQLSLTEWHPFSVASGPSEPHIDLYIRALGDHTRKIVDYSEECASNSRQALIRVDGPYGNLSFNYRRYGSLILVGGGIGITPIISLLKDIYESVEMNRNEKISHCMKYVHVVWIMPHKSETVLFLSQLMDFQEHSGYNHIPRLNISVHVTREEESTSCNAMIEPIFYSKPDFSLVMNECTMESKHVGSSSILVYACGPGRMVNQLWDASMRENSRNLRVDFHHESFEF